MNASPNGAGPDVRALVESFKHILPKLDGEDTAPEILAEALEIAKSLRAADAAISLDGTTEREDLATYGTTWRLVVGGIATASWRSTVLLDGSGGADYWLDLEDDECTIPDVLFAALGVEYSATDVELDLDDVAADQAELGLTDDDGDDEEEDDDEEDDEDEEDEEDAEDDEDDDDDDGDE